MAKQPKKTISVEEIAQLPRVRMAFCYRYFGTDEKPVFVWVNERNVTKLYGTKLVKDLRPGLIFEFPETTDGESVVSTQGKWTGEVWAKDDQVMEWQVRDRLFVQQQESKKRLAKVIDNGPLQKSVMSMRLAFRALPITQRPQFIAWLVYELNK